MDIEQVKRWYWVRRALNKLRRRPKQPDEKLKAVLDDHKIDHVLDVGANIGQTQAKLREIGFRGQITSFEPLPNAHGLLVEKSAADPNWKIADRVAIGAEPGEAAINVSEASDMSSLLDLNAEALAAFHKSKVIETVPTPVQPLDTLWQQYVEDGDRVFLKIDTQGYEKHVLDGAEETLKRIIGIQIELSLLPLYSGETHYIDLLKRLEDAGFETFILAETSFSVDLRRQLQVDAIMFHPDRAKA